MNNREKNNNQEEIKTNFFADKKPFQDIVITLALAMDLKSLFLFRSVAKYFLDLLDSTCFWNNYAKLHLIPEQITEDIKDIDGLKKSLIERFSSQSLQQNLIGLKNIYIKTIYPNLFFNNNKDKNIQFTISVQGKRFSADEIHSLIINDRSEELFSKVTRLERMIPYFIGLKDTPQEEFKNKLFRLEEHGVLMADLCLADFGFIGLFPFIMKVRAINCFEFLIRAYLILSETFEERLTENFRPNIISQMIFRHAQAVKNDFFIKKFLNLVLNTCKQNHYLEKIIKIIIKKGYEASLTKSLQDTFLNLSKEKKNIIVNFCINHNICMEYIAQVAAKKTAWVGLKNNMFHATYQIFKNEDISLEELTIMQNSLNERFEQLKATLASKAEEDNLSLLKFKK